MNAQRLHFYQSPTITGEPPESASGLSVRSVVYETENHRHDGCAFFSANALAAIQITERQARNMDDVQSLGVIYINHNIATQHEAEQALSQMSDAQGAKYLFSLS